MADLHLLSWRRGIYAGSSIFRIYAESRIDGQYASSSINAIYAEFRICCEYAQFGMNEDQRWA